MSVNINADTTNGLVLTSDTSGEIKLQSAGADIATVDSSGITMAAGKTLPASALTGSLPAGMGGKILQVVSTLRTGEFTTTSGSFVDVTGVTATITPSSTSSKIYISMSVPVGDSAGAYAHMRVLRNGTAIGLGATPNSNAAGVSFVTQGYQSSNQCLTIPFTFLDSPSTTSAVTYKLQTKTFAGRTIFINRTPDVGDANIGKVASSTITLFEIGA